MDALFARSSLPDSSFLGLVALLQRDCHCLFDGERMKRPLGWCPGSFQWLLSQNFAWGLGVADAKAGSELQLFSYGTEEDHSGRASFTGKLKSQLAVSIQGCLCSQSHS